MKLHPVNLLSSNLIEVFVTHLPPPLRTLPKNLTLIKENVIYKKLNDLNTWYMRKIGLDEVKLYQDRVVNLQQKLQTAQEHRKEMALMLAAIQKKSSELQDKLQKANRHDDLDRFLDMIRDEIEVLKQEKEMQERYMNCNRDEQEIFTAFTNAIRDSHEKQRAQSEYTKYLGLILGILGSFLAFTYSTIRKNDLKDFIEKTTISMNVQHNQKQHVGEIFQKQIVVEVPDNKTILICCVSAFVGLVILRIIAG